MTMWRVYVDGEQYRVGALTEFKTLELVNVLRRLVNLEADVFSFERVKEAKA